MEESSTSPRVFPLGATYQPIKKNGLYNSQSEKTYLLWVRFNTATNENKASWNCGRLIFRKFRSPEKTTGAPSIVSCFNVTTNSQWFDTSNDNLTAVREYFLDN